MIQEVSKFFGEVRLELRRVEWPSLVEFRGATVVVLFLLLVFAVYLGVVDRALLLLEKIFLSYTV